MENEYMEKVKLFVNAHLKDEFSINQVAEYVGYSAFHLARAFKHTTGLSIMEYARNQRILSASKEIGIGSNICHVAMEYGFDTHAGFTKAFISVFGCTPKQFQEHAVKMKNKEGIVLMDNTKIVIRHVCKDDVQDLWENVYSAMTPRQITEDKILPATEAYKAGNGLLLVAEVDGRVVMSLHLTKPAWIPLGFVWDNNYRLTGGDEDLIMQKLVDGLKYHAKHLNISALLSPQGKNTEESKAMQAFGFVKVFEAGDWEYLMLSV